MQNFHRRIWPLGFHGSEFSTWHHHWCCRTLQGVRANPSPHFLVGPKAAWAVQIPAELPSNAMGQGKGWPELPVQCGSPEVMPGVRLRLDTGSCRWAGGDGEGGASPRTSAMRTHSHFPGRTMTCGSETRRGHQVGQRDGAPLLRLRELGLFRIEEASG